MRFLKLWLCLILTSGCGAGGFHSAELGQNSTGTGVGGLTCVLQASSTDILSGQSITLLLTTSGPVVRATLNGQSVAAGGTSVTILPPNNIRYSATVESSVGDTVTCESPLIVVQTPAGQNPSCTISASQNNLVPGDATTLTLTVVGSAQASSLNGKSLGPVGGTVILSPVASSTVSGSVQFAGGASTCSLALTVKTKAQLSKDELYRAKLGPNSLSVDGLLTTRCSTCHDGTASANATASSWVLLRANDTSGNLTRLKRVVNPSTGALFSDMTKPPVNTSIWQFMNGHKTKNPPYTQADLDYVLSYVNTP